MRYLIFFTITIIFLIGWLRRRPSNKLVPISHFVEATLRTLLDPTGEMLPNRNRFRFLQRQALVAAADNLEISITGASIIRGNLLVLMHPDDAAWLGKDAAHRFCTGITEVFSAHAASRKWQVIGTTCFDMDVSDDVRQANPRVEINPAVTMPAPTRTAPSTGHTGSPAVNPLGDATPQAEPDQPASPTFLKTVAVGDLKTVPITGFHADPVDQHHHLPTLLAGTADIELTIGRGPAADTILDVPTVSQMHATIRRAGTGWEINDLGSTNGTWLNGRRLTNPTRLHTGDVLEVSKGVSFVVR